MSDESTTVALVTGANSGIGREVARQLALTSRYTTIVLACRDATKAERAKAELEAETGKRIYQILLVDIADVADVRRAVRSLTVAVDDLIMNAGGAGGPTPMALTKDGVTQIFASNVLGHAVLLGELLEAQKLRHTALYVGSEAARGVPLLKMKRPTLPTYSVAELTSLCDGSFFRGGPVDGGLAYGQAKLMAALWLSAWARRHPHLKLLTVSPGNTSGTAISEDYPRPLRLFLKYVFTPFIAPALGAVHDVKHGAARIVGALTDPALCSGGFYASGPKALIGPLVEQGEIYAELADPRIQNNAAEVVEHFTGSSASATL
jgi:NAD(P)-dependent dehydrogenase (short-subunit alcohol dehydrogenase family)